MSVMFSVLCVLLILTCLLYRYSRRKYNYWRDKKVPFLEPLTVFGNYKDYVLLKFYHPLITKKICERFPDAPYIGVYYGTDPALIVKDPELIKLITTKDFYYFNGREVSHTTHKEVITQNLFFTQGERWKVLRQNLTPLFSSSKMKNMFYMIKKCSQNFETLLERELKTSSIVEVRSLMSRFTIDSISFCAFGFHADAMGDSAEVNPFRTISTQILAISTYNGIKNMTRALWPDFFYALGLQMFSPKIDDFFHKLLMEVFEKRQYQPSSRNDFVDLILSLYKNTYISGDSLNNLKTGGHEKVNIKVDDDLLVAQCVAFFTAGFETSSTASTFTLFELAKHQDIQKRAIADVDAYFLRHKDGVEYDITSEVPYLEACLDEALRMYPIFGAITREVMENYQLPDGLWLDKGVRIHIPINYIHSNPEFFEKPNEFNPERFLGEKKKYLKSYTYMPFGEGPRICIGMRFAKMQVLTGLATILKNYTVKLADSTPGEMKFEPKAIIAQPAEPIRLVFTPRHNIIFMYIYVRRRLSVMFSVLCLLSIVLCLLYRYCRRNYNYWRDKNVPFLEPVTLFGNYKDYILLKSFPPVITKKICERFPDAPYVGVYYGTEPALVVKDPELIKLITTKDFYYFNGREVSHTTHKEVITQNIFFTQSDRWKVLRQNLTPLFSSSKMKNMFYMIKNCSKKFEALLERELKTSSIVEIRSLMSRFTIDSISFCAFGFNADAMGDSAEVNPFRTISTQILAISTLNGIKNMTRALWPDIFYALGLQMFSPKINDFFHKLLMEVFEKRQYQPSSRNDFVDLILSLHKNTYISGDSLINLKTGGNKKVNIKVDDDLLVGQCVAFFTAGFETSSSATSFTLFELAKHQEIQKRAIADVDAYFLRHEDGVDYDITSEVPYLEACLDETLRMYPLFGTVTREVMEDYQFPDGLRLEKGLRIHIPVNYIHSNPEYFEKPNEFNPERFLGEKKKYLKSYTYMPFGEGPRICIGMRFAKMQVLTGLATILKNYTVKLADGTPEEVRLEPKAIVTHPADPIRLVFTPRNI
ncbi:uncharacterized protein [Epargyreus clarus]|uniref:uncharacterized protein n=1 Tax=Epargyreus clarus TaxID=520877 RepID=UPI003C2F944F